MSRRPNTNSKAWLLWPAITGVVVAGGLLLLGWLWVRRDEELGVDSRLFFNGWVLPWWALVIAGAAVAASLIVMLLSYERKLVSSKVGASLLILRLSVLALLTITLLEPVLRWVSARHEKGRIIVAVDLSESMTIKDTHAGKAEKLRWARALGMIGNEKTNARLDRWIKSYSSGEEPQWVDKNEGGDAERRARLAQTRKETVEGVIAHVDKLSRKEIALKLLTQGDDALIPKLQKIARVEVRVFADKPEGADPTTLEKLVAAPPKSINVKMSDMAAALSSAGTGDSSKVLGVVLLTDGRDNANRDAVGAAERLGQSSAPVLPVLLGTVLRPTDIAIAELDHPPKAYKEEKALLKAKLNTSGFEGEEIKVYLERKGKEPLVQTVTPDGPDAQVTFDLDTDKLGRHEYVIRTDVRKGEVRDDNNSRKFAFAVVDDKVRVLLLEGEARWEFRFLDNALQRDKHVEVQKVVFRQPYMGVLQSTFFPRSLKLPADADDVENSPFAEPDVVILGDVDPAELPRKGWEMLEKFVGEGGGTLVMMAGKEYMPLAYRSPLVDALLPVSKLQPLDMNGPEAESAPTERGFNLQLTPEGERESFFQFDVDAGKNKAIWASLPGHMWGLLGEAKPGSTPLAYAFQKGRELTLQDQRKNSIVVSQPYGFGQVLWIGIDSTWRWRHRVGDKYHHRFWGQVGRWAATNKADAGNKYVRFGIKDTKNGDVAAGDDAQLFARFTKSFAKRFPELKAKVQIFKREQADGDRPNLEGRKPFSTIDLKPEKYRPLIHRGRAVQLPIGEYWCKLVVEGANLGGEAVISPLFVKDIVSAELRDLSCNRQLLDQLADVSRGKTRGRVFLPDEIDKIPEVFINPDVASLLGKETLIWDHWVIMLLFFGLLTVEWVVRKLNGLP